MRNGDALMTADNGPSRRSVLAALAASLVLTACGEYKPYTSAKLRRNDREEGPEGGLFTGKDGEFKIFGAVKKKPEGAEGEEPGTAGGGLAPDPNPSYEPGSGSGAPPKGEGGKVLF